MEVKTTEIKVTMKNSAGEEFECQLVDFDKCKNCGNTEEMEKFLSLEHGTHKFCSKCQSLFFENKN